MSFHVTTRAYPWLTLVIVSSRSAFVALFDFADLCGPLVNIEVVCLFIGVRSNRLSG